MAAGSCTKFRDPKLQQRFAAKSVQDTVHTCAHVQTHSLRSALFSASADCSLCAVEPLSWVCGIVRARRSVRAPRRARSRAASAFRSTLKEELYGELIQDTVRTVTRLQSRGFHSALFADVTYSHKSVCVFGRLACVQTSAF